MLEYLHLKNVGPAPEMELELAPRLNLLTGDNGLGKSFLLDVAWWALTRRWPHDVNKALISGYPARPRDVRKPASISYRVRSKTKTVEFTSKFSKDDQVWPYRPGRPHSPGLVIYAHADGGFSVWDPARNYWKPKDESAEKVVPAFVFTPRQVWRGLTVKGIEDPVCLGLLQDWSTWIREDGTLAAQMRDTLKALASSGDQLAVGPLRQFGANAALSYPTIATPYSDAVPVLHASAGVRRVLALAYILIWSWDRHVAFAEAKGLDQSNRVIFLFDEIEAHLHPKWQRSILGSVLNVAGVLHQDADVQLLAATHSPLVLASAEPIFDDDKDKLFNIALDNGGVKLDEVVWAKQGDVVNWLVSETFGLEQARSIAAEEAIEAAEAWMRGDKAALPANLRTAQAIDAELKRVLAGHDDFWPRWVVWRERKRAR